MNKQLALSISLNETTRLSDFNWTNNELLQEQLTKMLSLEGERLLYLWGTSGSGKTHILKACCHHLHTKEAAIYVPLMTLKEWGPNILEGLEEQRLVCIDDIDVIANDTGFEEALFHLYNKIKDRDKSILIISGHVAPHQLPIRLNDLRSRLSGSLVIGLNELPDEEKINTLKLQALNRGFDLPESVGQFLLNRCSRNMHDLQKVLNQLDEASLAAKRKVTIPFVRDLLTL